MSSWLRFFNPSLCLLGLLLSLGSNGVGATSQTGVNLQAIDMAGQPAWWYLEEVASNKGIAKVEGRWGFAPVPPGKYRVIVLPRGARSRTVLWDTVTVVDGKTSLLSIDSGIELTGGSNWSTPPEWWFIDDAGGERVAQVHRRWGFTPLPVGSYRLQVVPQGKNSLPVDWGPIDVRAGQISRLALNSGIALRAGLYEGDPPDWWYVDDTKGKRVAQVSERWSATPLPPGQYTVGLPFGYATGKTSSAVSPDQITGVTVADLGVGRLVVELPAAWGANLVGAPGKFELHFKRDDKVWGVSLPKGDQTERVVLGLEAGPLTLIYRNGVMKLEKPVRVVAGREISVPFDTIELATKNKLSTFTLGGDDSGTSAGELLVARATNGEPLMLQHATGGSTWLAPGNAYLRWRLGDAETVIRELPVADHLTIPVPSQPRGQDQKGQIWVDVVIQVPADGTVVETDQVELVGRAAVGAEAGTTQILLLMDTSGSTGEQSGSDLDGDGKQETVFEAELAAARILIEELGKIEDETPGDAFAVGLLRFSDSAELIAPLIPLSKPEATGDLRTALERLLKRDPDGDTYYDRGLDTALDTFARAGLRGPRIILLISDGKPSDLKAALAAATRTGQARSVVHALGLGKDFKGNLARKPRFPPYPSSGVDILGLVAALAHTGSEVFLLPRPGDVVNIVRQLPVLERVDAGLKTVVVDNVTTGQTAEESAVSTDGSFVAVVPVSLLPLGDHQENTLRATAIALDDLSQASDQVRVRAPTVSRTVLDRLDRLVAENTRLIEVAAAAKKTAEDCESTLVDCTRLREALDREKAMIERRLQATALDGAERQTKLENALQTAHRQLEDCTADKERLNGERTAAAAEFDGLRKKLKQCYADIHFLKGDYSELNRSLQQMGDNLADCTDQKAALAGEKTVLLSRLHDQQQACTEAKKALDTRFQQLQSEAQGTTRSVDKLQAKMEAQQVELTMAQQAQNRLDRQLAACVARQTTDTSARAELDARLAQLKGKLESMTIELQDERRITNTLRSERETLKTQLATMAARINQLEREAKLARCPTTPGRLRVTAAPPDKAIPTQLLPQVELILDVSNSMWGRIDGETKMAVAQRVIGRVIDDLPPNISVALRVYGHRKHYRKPGACLDTELLIPFAPLDKEDLVKHVSGLRPTGKTPIAYALQQIGKDFAGVSGEKIVVLVTDGDEECGGDPHQVVVDLMRAGFAVRLFVVGFALADETTKEMMRQVAEATGGHFFDARAAEGLESAVTTSFRIPYEVINADGVILARGRVDHDPVELAAGTYRIKVYAPSAAIEIRDLKIEPGRLTEVPLSSGN